MFPSVYKCHVSGHLSSALPTAAALFVTSFPLDMTPRLNGVGLCVRGGELELLDGEGFCHSELQERCQILQMAVSEGTCLIVDDDFSCSVNSNCSFTQDHRCFYMFLICAPVILVSDHADAFCPGGIVCTDIFLGLHPKAFTPITLRFHPSLTAPLALGFGGAHCHGMFTGLEGVSAASVFSTP